MLWSNFLVFLCQAPLGKKVSGTVLAEGARHSAAEWCQARFFEKNFLKQ
jgi:hypothetical protein